MQPRPWNRLEHIAIEARAGVSCRRLQALEDEAFIYASSVTPIASRYTD
jgi:hypothetical protein